MRSREERLPPLTCDDPEADEVFRLLGLVEHYETVLRAIAEEGDHTSSMRARIALDPNLRTPRATGVGKRSEK